MKRNKQFAGGGRVLGLLVLAAAVPVWADPTTQPAVAQSPATQPSVASVLADMDAAYSQLQSARFDGHIAGHFDVAGQVKDQDTSFASSFNAPNQFRHESHDDILLGSTGTSVYSYLPKRDQYQSADAPKTRVASSEWPASVSQILSAQNPSLLLAISKSAASELKELSKQITLEPATVVDGVSYDTLKFDIAADHQIVTLLVDPTTHLLHEAKFDLKKSLEAAGAADVKEAEITVDYTVSTPDVPVAASQFAWSAPVGAMLTNATTALMAGGDADLSDEQKALIGKDAPDFALKGLDDKVVKLSDLKGSVVIVDFWATWCRPCVKSLPHLDALYKEKSPAGLKVLAVNLQQDKDTVAAFVKKQGWTLPIVLDTEASAASNYQATAIPQTVVVGKDGKIKQIFVGGGHEDDIKKLVEEEMK
jgi:peroxiredoxin